MNLTIIFREKRACLNIFVTLIFATLFLSSCSVFKFAKYYASADDNEDGKLKGRVYQSEYTSYEIGELSERWEKIKVGGGDVAFLNENIGATITVDSTCNKKGKYSLKALSESLLIGIEDKKLIQRNELTLSGENALSSIYTGKLDGVPLKINAIVFKKGNCIYDFTYTSSPDNFSNGFGDFHEFISNFEVKK
ncbi:MAG TPA: hypothetical protein VHT73_05280 [Thermodesulfobacteriota bacterium]|nr:hypothetical protein [Thermodesulfobacteriota bacterium]